MFATVRRSPRPGRLPCGSGGIQRHPASLLATALAGIGSVIPCLQNPVRVSRAVHGLG